MGNVHYEFSSSVLGKSTYMNLILPEESIMQGKMPAATLYLLHGGGGNATDWVRYTSIERYADEHQVAVVMPEVDGNCFYTDMEYGYKYFTFLKDEVPKVAEMVFHVNNQKENRYVAGLSMGGYGAFKWAFLCPDFFKAAANLSGFSSIVDIFSADKGFASHEFGKRHGLIQLNWESLDELKGSMNDSKQWIDDAAEKHTELPALFAAIGTEDFSYRIGQEYLAYVKEKGISIHYEEMPGKHEWKVWDKMIERFLIWVETI